MRIGYGRVSKEEQHLHLQQTASDAQAGNGVREPARHEAGFLTDHEGQPRPRARRSREVPVSRLEKDTFAL